MIEIKHIRNFSIIAHVDHGKSTLADRLIEMCGSLEKRDMSEQVLDSMEIEKERGITIKAQTVRLLHRVHNKEYVLNLIDTPGHVDFGYEVDRSLAACEGSILVVDATQGVEAQTLANTYKALDNNHEIILVLNKVDLPAADPERIKKQIEEVIGLDASKAIQISAKTGWGVEKVLEAITQILPAPRTMEGLETLQAMLVDSWYDRYLGIVILLRIKHGNISKGMKIKTLSNNVEYVVERVGIFTPKKQAVSSLSAGEVGFISGNIKHASDCKIGDTITTVVNGCSKKLEGFKPSTPVIFCGIYPTDVNSYNEMRDSMAKLQLNDGSFTYEKETSTALGLGFRCGFLGMLHLEIMQERLAREFSIDLVTTAPSVVYRVHLKTGKVLDLHSPVDMPDPTKVNCIEEPWVQATMMLPEEYLGAIITLCIEKRGVQKELNYIGNRVMLVFQLPLNEIVFDFYEKLKSYSKGYASCDWKVTNYIQSNLVRLTIIINGHIVDALSLITHHGKAENVGRKICQHLKELIPRHLFPVAIQASIGGKIVARETISPFRKDVTAKLYGGDVTRKKKLLEKQKKGKKRLSSIGNVEVPQSAFIAVLKVSK